MDAARGAEQLARVRSEVHRACELLIASTPEAINNCQEALQRAVAILQGFRPDIGEYPQGFDAGAFGLALKSDVLRAARLLENLAGFYRGWERILGAMSGGYTSKGAPAAVDRQGRLCCRV